MIDPVDFFVLYLDLAREIIRTLILLSVTAFFCYLSIYSLATFFKRLHGPWRTYREIATLRHELRVLRDTLLSLVPTERGQVLNAEQYAAWEREQMFSLWRVIYNKRGASTGEEATTKEQASTDDC